MKSRLVVVIVGVLLIASACDWTMDGFGASRTGHNPYDISITADNIGQLQQLWTATLIAPGGDPAVAGGRVFVNTAGALQTIDQYAFDAAGVTNCSPGSPRICQPLWSLPFTNIYPGIVPNQFLGNPAVNGDTVYSGINQVCTRTSASSGSIVANDTASGKGLFASVGDTGSPAIDGGHLYTTATFCSQQIQATLSVLVELDPSTGAAAFSAAGPYVLDGAQLGPPAVASGVMYATDSFGGLDAFDAAGQTNCGPNPYQAEGDPTATFCGPLWTGAAPVLRSYPAVANGLVYAAAADQSGTLYAFPAGGCGAATCDPSWSTSVGTTITAPAVTDQLVFVGGANGTLYALPANGCGSSTCQPVWTAGGDGTALGTPTVAGGLVYVGTTGGHIEVYDASGCGQASCAPLRSINVGAPVTTSPAVANSRIYVTDGASTLHAYALP